MPAMILPSAGLARRLLRVVLWLSLSWAATAGAQPVLQVELDAPAEVRPLLKRYLKVLQDEIARPADPLDRAALARRTAREATELLATEGYFAPRVTVEETESADRPWRIVIVPGARALISNVDIRFLGELAEPGDAERQAALRAAWLLAQGRPFRQADWDEAKRRLVEEVSAREYAAAYIADSRAEVDAEQARVRLQVTVDSGPRFVLGRLEVSGLKRLPPDLVKRYSGLKPGDPFDQDRLLALQSQLQNVPQFASVVVDIDRDPALAAEVPVRVQVSEAQSRHFAIGAGYSTNSGARGELSWRDLNLAERAWELASGLRLEQLRQSMYADVILPPAASGHRNSVGAALERSDIEGLALTTQAVGVARTHERADGTAQVATRVALRLQQERRAPEAAQATRRTALTLNGSWIRRAVDDVLDPRRGYVLQLEVGGGSRAALSDQNFLRLFGRYVRYQPLGVHDILVLRAEAGATLAPSRDGVPQDFLFRSGGTQSVRGYAWQSLGVREGDAVVGGRYLAVAGAEHVHWFDDRWGAAAFADWGDVAEAPGGLKIKAGYGFGARWRSPAGPLALDLAYGEAERRVRLHFGIAIAF